MEFFVSNQKNVVNVEDVKKIARLSRLHVEDTELQSLADDLSGILGWIEQLNEVDVDKVKPMTSAVAMKSPMRKDIVSDGGKRDQILKNAPKEDDGFFVVPRSVE
jgi:aspartyl-tRNA(Asn)/glutamyl-tRNA(Gln) amidotransferase subunit C|tara:strand:+ start:1345 stop:1659 length:315 start_codon:yes stop_codon:yes gene_type:complete